MCGRRVEEIGDKIQSVVLGYEIDIVKYWADTKWKTSEIELSLMEQTCCQHCSCGKIL